MIIIFMSAHVSDTREKYESTVFASQNIQLTLLTPGFLSTEESFKSDGEDIVLTQNFFRRLKEHWKKKICEICVKLNEKRIKKAKNDSGNVNQDT